MANEDLGGPIFDFVPVMLDNISPQQRVINHIERIELFALTPPSPKYVKTTDRKGGISIQFLRVKGAEGYEVSVASDPGMTNVQYRQLWEGNSNTSGFVPLGQVSGTFYARVRSYRGKKFSSDIQSGPCGISQITGTASEVTAGTESVPAQVGADQGSSVTFGSKRHIDEPFLN